MKEKILFADIELEGKIILKDVILKELDTEYYYKKKKKKLKIISIIKSKHVGYVNQTKEYTEVKASEEKRNNITGAYE